MKITTNNSKIILGKNNTISPWAALQIITYNPPGKESHGTVIIGNNNCFNGNFLINSLIAGSPATTKRNNIGWHEYLDSSYLHTVNPRQQLKG